MDSLALEPVCLSDVVLSQTLPSSVTLGVLSNLFESQGAHL